MLFYLLTFKANTSYGAYRRLMFSYTIVELMYSVISVMSGMMAHSTETSFVVFDLYEGYVSRYLAPIFLIDFCAFYFTLILLLVVHFIYRYVVVCDFKKMEYFNGGYLMFWVFGSAACGVSMCILKFFAFPETERRSIELSEEFSLYYNLTMDQVVYNGPNYYICNENDECEMPLKDWTAMMILSNGLIFSIVIMLYCGYRCCVKLNKNDKQTSCRTVDLQKQLMIALIIQSVIPIIFMYIPILLLFITPMFKIGLGPYVNIAMATLSIYPPIDQFAIIYVIKDFRIGIFSNVEKNQTIRPLQQSSLQD
nr:hypothetical protein F59E11.14 - Caenorhabditis elegans [Caenorhabditis elegans]